jgi:hypothetical protein
LFCRRSLELLTLEGGGQALHSLLEVSPFSSELVASSVLCGLALAVCPGPLGVVGPLAGTSGATTGFGQQFGHSHRINARDEKAGLTACILCHSSPRPRRARPRPVPAPPPQPWRRAAFRPPPTGPAAAPGRLRTPAALTRAL